VPLLSEDNRRKRNLVIIGAFLLLVGAASVLDVGVYAPDVPIASNITVFALFNLNLIVLLLLLVLLLRNVIKLWFERRQHVIGARFKTKLVVSFLVLSLAPASLIFFIASNLINRSIEGWFKPQVERPLDQALAVAQTYYANLEKSALRHAKHIANRIDHEALLPADRREALTSYLLDQRERLGLGTITVFGSDGQELVHVRDPILGDLPTRDVSQNHVRRGADGQEVTTVRELESGDLIEAVVPVWDSQSTTSRVAGVVVVGTHVTERLESRVRGISQAFREYKQLKLLKAPIKGIYILMFLFMTLIVIFSFTWFGLYLARGITGPIAALAAATREVAAGNLSYKVQARADDEIGVLVESFNRMIDDLGESKRRLEEAYLDLSDKHTELEDRRRYIETVLEAITTGVVSFDPLGRVTTINRAAARMLDLDADASVGRLLEEVFAGADVKAVTTLIARTQRPKADAAALQLQVRRGGATLSLLASATALRGPDGEHAGAVVVFDDLTELLKAQRVAAWREVAQRIAHEIKNPLTPIQLSAQRLQRRLGRAGGDEGLLVNECAEAIVQEVEGLRKLVDEFSRFARMPVLSPRPTDVRQIVDTVASLYRDSHPALTLVTRYAPDLPLLEVDPDHIKRAVLNLVDNAVEAVEGVGAVLVECEHLPGSAVARIVVADTGPGIRPEDRDKLFLPYYSTKVTGMGLGLPIVHEIVTEHGGTIVVEDNQPRGSRFIVEVPVARSGMPVEA